MKPSCQNVELFKPFSTNPRGPFFVSHITPSFMSEVVKLLDKLFHPGVAYKKAGVSLENIHREGEMKDDLFAFENEKADNLSRVIDRLNDRFGKGTISFSTAKREGNDWKMKREHRSPSYTTKFSELLSVS